MSKHNHKEHENKNCECNNVESTCECNKEKEECNCNKDNPECNNELQEKVTALQEALLRNQAELMNFKRRKEEETSRLLKYANEDIILGFLPILDNIERAINMDDDNLEDEVSKFLAGFKLIYTNTINILNKFEVSEISAEGVEFDPSFHHAVLTDHDENKPAGVVLEVLQKGYLYKDRVIRPAMVKVNE